jgi:hypothetical protein
MPKVRFIADFDWHARRGVVISYKAGKEYPVTQRCADDAAVAGKVAKPLMATRPKKGGDDAGG